MEILWNVSRTKANAAQMSILLNTAEQHWYLHALLSLQHMINLYIMYIYSPVQCISNLPYKRWSSQKTVMRVLMFAFFISSIKAIDPQKAVNITALLVRLQSLETNFAILSNNFSGVSKELKMEKVARQGLEQELNKTKISNNDALQQIMKNTSDDMKHSLSFMNNITTTLFHQMANSVRFE